MRLGDQTPFGAFPEIPTFLTGMDGEPFFVTGLGGEGLGKKSMGRGEAGNPPFPWEHTVCISWLKSYAAAKEILICIASCEVNLLNIHNLDRNHN